MGLCDCGHHEDTHCKNPNHTCDGSCLLCGCPAYKPRHDPRYDPDDVGDQGYADEGFPYSGLGKVKR